MILTANFRFFVNIIDGLKPLTIFTKSSILDVSQSSVYASVLKLQVLFIKHTSSEFIVTHFESIAMYLMSFLLA